MEDAALPSPFSSCLVPKRAQWRVFLLLWQEDLKTQYCSSTSCVARLVCKCSNDLPRLQSVYPLVNNGDFTLMLIVALPTKAAKEHERTGPLETHSNDVSQACSPMLIEME